MSIEAEIMDRLRALASGVSVAKKALFQEQRQGPRFTPKPLQAYAQTPGSPWPRACKRCLSVAEHWITRVYADWREVRFCRQCWKQWDARSKGRAA